MIFFLAKWMSILLLSFYFGLGVYVNVVVYLLDSYHHRRWQEVYYEVSTDNFCQFKRSNLCHFVFLFSLCGCVQSIKLLVGLHLFPIQIPILFIHTGIYRETYLEHGKILTKCGNWNGKRGNFPQLPACVESGDV